MDTDTKATVWGSLRDRSKVTATWPAVIIALMASLQWIGKEAVVGHHREVPYHLLKPDPARSVGDDHGVGSGNLLVQGDNLLALKALLPYYAGKVKCIYIDPPYNTGNEKWVYNDNVNSPEIRQWLGKVVGKEGETLDRHDRWLCMMYPRLALLKEFLREDGIILVSIDDFEVARLRQLLDELLGVQNFIAQLVWEKGRKNDAKLFSVGHEYMLVFAKSKTTLRDTEWRAAKDGIDEIAAEYHRLRNAHASDDAEVSKGLVAFYKSLPKDHPAKKYSRSKNADKRGVWRDNNISWPGGGGPKYDIDHPITGKPCKVPDDGWRFIEATMKEKIRDDWVVFREDHRKSPFLKSYIYLEDAYANLEDGEENEGQKEVLGSVFYRHSQPSLDLIKDIFGEKVFSNPKDHEILAKLIRYVTKGQKDALILDSFAGSGTTAHAVLTMNKADGGNRRCILVEMDPTIATDITAQRLKKVIQGYHPQGDTAKDKVEGTGGGFRYVTLGDPVFNEDGQVKAGVSFAELAAHVFFTETGEPIPKPVNGKRSPLLGACRGTAYYLLFNGILGDKRPDGGNVLTADVLEHLPKHDGPKVVFGEACRLGEARLKRANVTFRQIPYQIKVS